MFGVVAPILDEVVVVVVVLLLLVVVVRNLWKKFVVATAGCWQKIALPLKDYLSRSVVVVAADVVVVTFLSTFCLHGSKKIYRISGNPPTCLSLPLQIKLNSLRNKKYFLTLFYKKHPSDKQIMICFDLENQP